jgi:hypothetical protein
MTHKLYLDPTDDTSAYKLVIEGDSSIVQAPSATMFVTGNLADTLVEATVNAIRGIAGITAVTCYQLHPTTDGIVIYGP